MLKTNGDEISLTHIEFPAMAMSEVVSYFHDRNAKIDCLPDITIAEMLANVAALCGEPINNASFEPIYGSKGQVVLNGNETFLVEWRQIIDHVLPRLEAGATLKATLLEFHASQNWTSRLISCDLATGTFTCRHDNGELVVRLLSRVYAPEGAYWYDDCFFLSHDGTLINVSL
jgi:hypothetical protein